MVELSSQNASCMQVMDSLVVSLSKFTAPLTPGASPKPIVAFGFDDKGRMATETIFTVANRQVCLFVCWLESLMPQAVWLLRPSPLWSSGLSVCVHMIRLVLISIILAFLSCWQRVMRGFWTDQ